MNAPSGGMSVAARPPRGVHKKLDVSFHLDSANMARVPPRPARILDQNLILVSDGASDANTSATRPRTPPRRQRSPRGACRRTTLRLGPPRCSGDDQVQGKTGTYAVGSADGPVQAVVILGGQAEGEAGLCGESDFGAADCVFNRAGDALKCQRRG
jgi:hypothetical protein